MSVEHALILAATGLLLGFLSALLGIGGGVLMTPVQIWLYTSAGIETDLAVKMAFATTLAVIWPTAASGVFRHQRLGAINWRAAISMGIFTLLGSLIGSTIASRLPGTDLKIALGVFGLIIVARMLTVKISDADRPLRDNLWLWCGLAFPIGIITGLLSIGGGIVVVPVLVLVLGFRMSKAAATSLAMMLFTSVGGIIGWTLNGLHASGLPEHTIGYIFWPAWVTLAACSIAAAQFGAVMAHRLPGKALNYIFIAIVVFVSLDMLGAIDALVRLF